MHMKWLQTALTVLILMVVFTPDAGALMTSTNYRLYGDSLGSVGGRGTSTNYLLDGTGGESTIPGEGSSTNYTLLAGFQSLAEHPTFTFSLSVSSLSLGALTVGSVNTASYTATTSTNAAHGFTTYVYEDGDLRSGANTIDDVADGSVTAGSEEYGIATSGTYALLGADTAITTSSLATASYTKWINGAETTITHKVARGTGTLAGTYSHIITYMSVGNF